jgi:hypothetical protein
MYTSPASEIASMRDSFVLLAWPYSNNNSISSSSKLLLIINYYYYLYYYYYYYFYKKQTPWSESASELHRPSDRRLSVK